MEKFCRIQPYNDSDVPIVLARLINNQSFLRAITHFFFPKLSKRFSYLLKPVIVYYLNRSFKDVNSIAGFQNKIESYVHRIIKRATKSVTYSGLGNLTPDIPYLFLANHRDIVMDPVFVNYAVYHGGMRTPRIAIGDNLLQEKFVSDLMRLNKSFIVHRNTKSLRERFAASKLLSQYINHSIRKDRESIWIAQSEGRAKDGNDRTDTAILKMLHMSCKEEKFSSTIDSLNIIPVTVSYEYDPCDVYKARELYIRKETGSYRKILGEDNHSIVQGITGYKGRVHVNFSGPIKDHFENRKELATQIDRLIIHGYRLFPINYLAYEQWSKGSLTSQVPRAKDIFLDDELIRARKTWEDRLQACPSEYRSYLVLQYAMPVYNQYRIKK